MTIYIIQYTTNISVSSALSKATVQANNLFLTSTLQSGIKHFSSSARIKTIFSKQIWVPNTFSNR